MSLLVGCGYSSVRTRAVVFLDNFVEEHQFLSIARKDCYQVQYHKYNKLKISIR